MMLTQLKPHFGQLHRFNEAAKTRALRPALHELAWLLLQRGIHTLIPTILFACSSPVFDTRYQTMCFSSSSTACEYHSMEYCNLQIMESMPLGTGAEIDPWFPCTNAPKIIYCASLVRFFLFQDNLVQLLGGKNYLLVLSWWNDRNE